MKTVSKVIKFYLEICNVIAGAALILLMLFITLNIIFRAFQMVIPGNVEIVSNVTTIIAFMGFGYCVLRDGHIKVDVIKKWPGIDRVYSIISIVLLSVVGYCCAVQGAVAYRLNLTTTILRFVRYPFYFITMLGFFSMALAVIYKEYTFYSEKFRLRHQKSNTEESV